MGEPVVITQQQYLDILNNKGDLDKLREIYREAEEANLPITDEHHWLFGYPQPDLRVRFINSKAIERLYVAD